MPENRYYSRGRRLLSYYTAANRAAELLGEDLPYPPRKAWILRMVLLLWFLITFGKRPKRPTPRPSNSRHIWWGGLRLRIEDAIGHFLVLGGTGVGKSLILQRLLHSVLSHFGPGKDQRAFVFDAKRELYSEIAASHPGIEIKLLDPFDERGAAWDLAADILCEADAIQFAECLIPASKGEEDRFWIVTGRNIAAAIIQTFIVTAPGKWTLRDVLLTMRSRERIAQVIGSNPETAHLWAEATRDERTLSNLMASFHAQLTRYNTVAALWHRCPRKFSLKEWISSDSILLVRSHPKYSAALQPFHQAMLDVLIDLILSQQDSQTRRTWMFLDECRDLGKVAKLPRCANLSRSVGCVIAAGVQSVEGMYEAYGGEYPATELLGLMRNVTFLRTSSPITSNYAERFFGSVEWLIERISHSRSSSGNGGATHSTSVDHTHRTEPSVLASEIMDIAPPSMEQPLQLFNDVPAIGAFTASLPLQHFLKPEGTPKASTPNVIEVGTRNQRLMEWTAADLKRLKLPQSMLLPAPAQIDAALAQLDVLTQLDNPNPSKAS